jgi:competence protein ComGC
MKTNPHHQSALTFVELCVVVVVLAVLISLLLPSLIRPRTHAPRISCTINLKHVGLATRLWSNDHGDQFPSASTNATGSRAWVNSPEVFRHYRVMSNELVTPKVLVCQSDRKRKTATDFTKFSNANLSYFVGLDAREDAPNSILSGDRNITGGTLSNGFLRVLTPGTAVEWTKEMHQNAGNIGLGDGSVQQVTTAKLRQQLALQTNAFIRLAVP